MLFMNFAQQIVYIQFAPFTSIKLTNAHFYVRSKGHQLINIINERFGNAILIRLWQSAHNFNCLLK